MVCAEKSYTVGIAGSFVERRDYATPAVVRSATD
jgi:hypothetical protein